jgi:hypothetical protein
MKLFGQQWKEKAKRDERDYISQQIFKANNEIDIIG